MPARRTIGPFIAALLMVASACGDDGAGTEATGPAEPGVPVTFTTEDGLNLKGTLFGAGTDAVVLGHMRPAEMDSWFEFAELLAAEGYMALAYNNRGYGDSEGDKGSFQVATDAKAAIDFARSRGAERVFYLGASMNGAAAMVVGADEDLAGVATLSGVVEFFGADAEAAAPSVEEPKLFIAAEDDGGAPEAARLFFDLSPGQKRLEIFPGSAHGTALFRDHREELTALLLEFVKSN
ncbi:MAG: alpha/beta hydrolase [Acidimicrobiia bacterium]